MSYDEIDHMERFQRLESDKSGGIGITHDNDAQGKPEWICVVARGVMAQCVNVAVRQMMAEVGVTDDELVVNEVNFRGQQN